MENPVEMPGLQLETLNPSMPSLSPFPSLAPRRRSHLDSASYRTLVRILSHCLDEPVGPPRGPRADPNPKPVAAHLKDPKTPSAEKDSILVGSGKSNDAILVKPELSKSPACSNPGQAGSANGESEKQQSGDAKAEASPADGELKHGDGTKENDECVHGGNADGGADPPGLIGIQDDIFHSIEEFLNDEGRGCESRDSEDAISGFLDESKSGKSQVQQDRRVSNTSCQDEVCSSSKELLAEEAKEAICGEPATEDCRVGKTLSVDEIIQGTQQEIRACSDAVAGCSGLESLLSLSDGGEVEEGEIPDDVQILEDQKLEEQGPEHDTIAKEEHQVHTLAAAYSDINPVDRHFGSRESICRADRSNLPIHVKVEMGQAICDDSYIEPQMNGTDINGTKAKCQLVPDSLASPGEDSENLATGIKGEPSGVQDVEAWMKKKRGPLTEERKAKKKKAKKRKRAEKNREQGVKRLKLLPIVKPKVVKYCNFYMMGRCHQGDLCKFSHDVTPTTKSQPCKYFASDSCLKGEDCPFDHQLSKYPCHRYMSNGMCSRNECKFSHQMPITEGSSTSTISKLDSPLLTEKQHKPKITSLVANDPPKNATSSTPFSMSKNLETNLVKCPKEPVRVPNGIRFLSFGKGPSDSANKQDKLLLEKHGGTKICNQENGKKMLANGRKNDLISEQNTHPVAQSGSKMMSSGALCPAAGNAFASKKSKTTGFISGPVVAPFSRSLQNEVSEASKILDEFLFGAGS